MDSDSDISFNYEDDEDPYFSDGDGLITSVYTEDRNRHNDVTSDSSPDIGVKLPLRHSPNLLSKFWYRSLRMEWYIDEHFVSKAKKLRDTILPAFTMGELLVMLQYKKWLVDEVTGDYYDNWPRLRDGCGLTSTRGEVHEIEIANDFVCAICCTEGDMAVFLLSCDHKYCAECYARYIHANIARGQLIRCMETNCNLSLLPEDVEKLLANYRAEKHFVYPEEEIDIESSNSASASDSESGDEYDRQFAKMDLSSKDSPYEENDPILKNEALTNSARVNIDTLHTKYRWCPALDCSNLAELTQDPRPETYDRSSDCDLANVPIVKCPNSHEFCFDCQYENHLPCPCWLVEKWIRKCEDDSETANWIEANTQSCPRCLSQIEKNGGCNHMTCRKCRFEFCWICLGEWVNHQSTYWKCNRYDAKEVEEVKRKRSDKQQSLNRYLHFYKRFSVHQTSMRGDEKTLANVHRCMLLYMKGRRLSSQKSVSWNDVQFLSDAIKSLTSGRKTLMWTYAFAFHLKKTNLSEIFEGMQDYLNKTVEDLSMLFEDISMISNNEDAVKKITKSKTEIVNLAALVTRRQQLLIECAHSELQLGFLQFAF